MHEVCVFVRTLLRGWIVLFFIWFLLTAQNKKMKHKQPSPGKRPKSPKQSSPRSSLIRNQDHPFQPQHSSIKKGEQEPYQSMKHKIAAAKHRLNDREVEMRNMQPHESSFGNSFPDDQITPPSRQGPKVAIPPLPIANMIPPQQNNPPPMPPPAFFPQAQQAPLAPNPMSIPPNGFAPNPMNGPPPPLAPNPMNMPPQSSLDPVMAAAGDNFFQQLGGFNAFYYNALDPSLAQKKNVPVSVPGSKHWPPLVGTILLIAAVIVMAVGIGKFLQTSSAIGIACGGLVIYLILSIFCSSIRAYIFNMKRLADYEALYNRLRQGRAYFVFFIECYHYKTTTRRTKRGTSSSKHKVVTHTARTEFNPTRYEDDSGEPAALKVHTPYAFVKYLKRFYFTDPGSQQRFISAFNSFVSSNRRDTHQNYHYSFEIAGFEPEVGFSYTGEGQHSKVLFFVFTLLGLAYPYSMWFENNVSRFQVNILKRLSV